ncbi:hypothetical protein OGAPHI_003573 [Ogataea philodendri]|uniref:Topoisomerase I damage affected protein 11 n=1 Tax=Ogataea philodendri TaxID=1378263 RepID=A0A9P8T4L8_9ASCO|nr:uncharacterized protein OGAPHI_003573 [Ogataea philodendri]KAH3665389.1 hypothetical protein OGAPHI_003573 [Ogataea philodendri]
MSQEQQEQQTFANDTESGDHVFHNRKTEVYTTKLRRNDSDSPFLSSQVAPSNGKRTGINLGLNVFESEVPQKKLDLNTVTPSKSEVNPPDPYGTKPSEDSHSPCSIHHKQLTSETKQEELSHFHGLSDELRLLASKEMEILEIKQQIKNLITRKRTLEFETQDLKIVIEKQLVGQITSSQKSSSRNKGLFEKHTPKSPSSMQKHRMKSVDVSDDPLLEGELSEPRLESTTSVDEEDSKSWFSKPLNLIQQIDSLIYQEIEKLHITPFAGVNSIEEETHVGASLDVKNNDLDAPLQDQGAQSYNLLGTPIKSTRTRPELDSNNTKDVMQSVSNKLWNFVNDVKQNLAVDEISTSSSPLSSPGKARTPSFSNRQSYGLHAKQRKRSMTNPSVSPQSQVLESEGENSPVRLQKYKTTREVELSNLKEKGPKRVDTSNMSP